MTKDDRDECPICGRIATLWLSNKGYFICGYCKVNEDSKEQPTGGTKKQ